MYKAILEGDYIVFNLSFIENPIAKSCGARWHPTTKKWRCKPTRMIASAIASRLKPEEIDPEITVLAGPTTSIPPMPCPPDAMVTGIGPDGNPIKLRDRQITAIQKAWPCAGFAFFHVMGAGKTLSTIALANLRREAGLIDRILVICPTSVKGVWFKEYARYSALSCHLQVLEAGQRISKWAGFPVLVVGVEALSQGGAGAIAEEFVAGGKCMTVIDESSTIKNHSTARTEKCVSLGEYSSFRLILTGTNVTQGIQDLYSQMYFADPTIIGELSYYGFRNKYCIMGGFEQRKIVGYMNTAVLFDKIRPYCDVVRKGDMKLPPKQYQTRDVRATLEQHRACKELAREMKTVMGDRVITVANALEAMLRFQQIAGGFYPDGTPLPKNPKMAELIALLEEFDGKAIIWARYLPEIAAITVALEERWPGSVLSLQGSVDSSMRQPLVDEFQINPNRRFFVTNQATGGKGLTLTAATLAVYYSNTFSGEDRLQSEDRNHRLGQENEVTYVDLLTDLKIDRLIATTLENKIGMYEFVQGSLLRIEDLI